MVFQFLWVVNLEPPCILGHQFLSVLLHVYSRYMVSVDATLCVSEALDALEAVGPMQYMTDIAHAPRTLFPRGSFLFYQVGVA